MESPRIISILVVACCCAHLCLQTGAAPEASRNRQNLFEPLLEFDVSDVPTVSTVSPYPSSPSRRQQAKREQQQSPNRGDDFKRIVDKQPDENPTDRPTSAQFAFSRQPQLVENNLSEQQQLSLDSFGHQPKKDSERHWSALDNYYNRLKTQKGPTYYQIPHDDDWDEPKDGSQYQIPPAAHQRVITNFPRPNPFDLPIGLTATRQAVPPSVHSAATHGISREGGIGAGGFYNPDMFPNGLLQTGKSDPSAGDQQENIQQDFHQLTQSQPRSPFLLWKRLPATLLAQQMQDKEKSILERSKHQEKTLGSYYRASSPERHDEAFCGPRNQFNPYLAQPASQLKGSRPWNPSVGAKLQEQLESLRFAQQSVSEIPSHMGVYNATVSDENYLCGASLVHYRFGLTLASCVQSMLNKQLQVRANEMFVGKNMSIDPFVIRQVKQVHLFPNYNIDSPVSEHNLALLELEQPIENSLHPNISPACQVRTRAQLRATNCWSPEREEKLQSFFDPDGEGETKERKEFTMKVMSVGLIADDDGECQKQTAIEHFNIQHPNYICATKNLQSVGANPLNQTSNFGSGIYCIEHNCLTLVSMLHPMQRNSLSRFGYLDLSYYRPWINSIIYQDNS